MYKRQGSWTLRTTGHPAHSSQIFKPEVGAGAVYEAARILSSFYTRLSNEAYLTFNPGLAAGGTRLTVAPAGLAAAALATGFEAPLVAGAPTGVVRARVTFGFEVGGVGSVVWSSVVGRSVIRLAYLADGVLARTVTEPFGRTSAILRGATTSVPSAEPWYRGHRRRA